MVAEPPAPPTQQQQQQQLVVEQETAAFVPSCDELRQLVNEIPWNATTTTTTTSSSSSSSSSSSANDTHTHLPSELPQSKQQLPTEIVTRIVQYLLVPRIRMEHVTAIACSSQHIATSVTTNDRSDHRQTLLAHCLTDDETTWWISDEGLDVRPQFVDFHCRPPNDSIHRHHHFHRVVRVRSVSVKIPPLPYGPMSLQQFVMQRRPLNHHGNSQNDDKNDNDIIIPWEAVSPVWTLDGHTLEYQTFDFPSAGVDVTHLRILCLSNQASTEVDRFNFPQMVGFYSIRFD